MGVIVGLLCGGAQFFILYKMVTKIASGAVSPFVILFGAGQFLLPMAVLLAVAFLDSSQLLGCGIAIAATLILCSVGFLLVRKKKK